MVFIVGAIVTPSVCLFLICPEIPPLLLAILVSKNCPGGMVSGIFFREFLSAGQVLKSKRSYLDLRLLVAR